MQNHYYLAHRAESVTVIYPVRSGKYGLLSTLMANRFCVPFAHKFIDSRIEGQAGHSKYRIVSELGTYKTSYRNCD